MFVFSFLFLVESYNGDIGLTKRDRDLNLLSESSPSLSNIKARLRDQHNDSVSFQLKSMASSNAGSTYLLPSTPSSNMKNSLVDTINGLKCNPFLYSHLFILYINL